jgi:hypothetical protein
MNTMTWPGFTQDFEHWLFMFDCQVCQMTKNNCKKYGMLPPKIAESHIVSLGHGLFGSGGTHLFTIRTLTKTHCLLALTMTDPAIGWFEIAEATNKSATSIQDLFQNTWLARYPYPQCIVFDSGLSSNVIANKCVISMVLNLNQLQVTTRRP